MAIIYLERESVHCSKKSLRCARLSKFNCKYLVLTCSRYDTGIILLTQHLCTGMQRKVQGFLDLKQVLYWSIPQLKSVCVWAGGGCSPASALGKVAAVNCPDSVFTSECGHALEHRTFPALTSTALTRLHG